MKFYYWGTFKKDPIPQYVGGEVVVYDEIEMAGIILFEMDKLCDNAGIYGNSEWLGVENQRDPKKRKLEDNSKKVALRIPVSNENDSDSYDNNSEPDATSNYDSDFESIHGYCDAKTRQQKCKRLYVCFVGVKQGFLAGCRPLIRLVDLKIKRDYEWTLMSEKQESIIQAIDSVFPNAKHRFCVKNLHANWLLAGFKGKALRDALWAAAKASTLTQFSTRMEEIAAIDLDAAKWFDDKPPSQ
ncbi:hypothetical protein ACH5RR_003766 [Cinchona calisaya]|uniref:Uncharacterized protein n=1 Tax=Cinchona calisaya TaxID=153742 RepID=A0ABD3AVT1_9GENT